MCSVVLAAIGSASRCNFWARIVDPDCHHKQPTSQISLFFNTQRMSLHRENAIILRFARGDSANHHQTITGA